MLLILHEPCADSEESGASRVYRRRWRRLAQDRPPLRPAAQVVPARGYKVSVNSMAFIVRATGPGVAVQQPRLYPRRFHRVRERSALAVLCVNHAFKGVVIPSAGDWEVVFEYRPARWGVSWILAGVAVVGRAHHAGTSDQRVDERLQGAILRRLGVNVDLPRLEDKQHQRGSRLTECLLYDVDRVPPGFHSPFRQIVAILERPAGTVRQLRQSGVPEDSDAPALGFSGVRAFN